MTTIRDSLFSRLEQIFGELKFEYNIEEHGNDPHIGSSLRVLAPIPDSDGQLALIEIIFTELGERMNYLQFYSTIAMKCNQSKDTLLQAINEVNFYCPVGYFGIFSEQGHLYHKYTLVFDDEEDDAEKMAGDALVAFHAIMMLFELRAPVLLKLALGVIDLESATSFVKP
ncbi:MAG: YbjN domain-containing protein [Oscillospiraceae bacterium]|jgi:hypothetical protein|nr:YbjN domain-containing protein [Oscillospiraceae bacterium]